MDTRYISEQIKVKTAPFNFKPSTNSRIQLINLPVKQFPKVLLTRINITDYVNEA